MLLRKASTFLSSIEFSYYHNNSPSCNKKRHMTIRSCAPTAKLALEQGHYLEPGFGNDRQSYRNLAKLFQGERKLLFHGATSFPGFHPKVIVGHSPLQQKHILTLSYFACQQDITMFLKFNKGLTLSIDNNHCSFLAPSKTGFC